MSEAAAAKDYWSRNHLQGASLPSEGHEHRWKLARHILSYDPESALEFGCASGRNLMVLRRLKKSGLALTGLDMNEITLGRARAHSTSSQFVLGDEAALGKWPDGHFDVVFTSSVLDHIPDPEWRHVYSQLVRLAEKAVVLHEPVLFEPLYQGAKSNKQIGRLVEADCATSGIVAAPFTYLHDYLVNDRRLRDVGPLPIEQTAEYREFGQLYRLLVREK